MRFSRRGCAVDFFKLFDHRISAHVTTWLDAVVLGNFVHFITLILEILYLLDGREERKYFKIFRS